MNWVQIEDPSSNNVCSIISRCYIKSRSIHIPIVAIDITKDDKDNVKLIYSVRIKKEIYWNAKGRDLPGGLEKELEEMMAIANKIITVEV